MKKAPDPVTGAFVLSISDRYPTRAPSVRRTATMNERPVLVAITAEGQSPTEDELLSIFEDKIAKWQIPDKVVFTDVLPRNATGKVLKRNLQDEFGEVLIGLRDACRPSGAVCARLALWQRIAVTTRPEI